MCSNISIVIDDLCNHKKSKYKQLLSLILRKKKKEKKYTKQNEQQYLISNQETQKHKKKTMTYDNATPDSDLVQARKQGRLKKKTSMGLRPLSFFHNWTSNGNTKKLMIAVGDQVK